MGWHEHNGHPLAEVIPLLNHLAETRAMQASLQGSAVRPRGADLGTGWRDLSARAD